MKWRYASGLLLAAASFVRAQEAPKDIRFRERVDVERVVLEARVVDNRGRALLGLQPSDFRVEVDGTVVPLESVRWLSGSPPPAGNDERGSTAEGAPVAAPGRLIVLFFQRGFEASRLIGLIRMQRRAAEFVQTLEPSDRVAVLTYDSHLKLRLDFTDEHQRVRALVGRVLSLGDAPPLPPGPLPSLAAHFDRDRARRAATPETALLVTAEALKALPGSKSLVLFGWGLGRFYPRFGVMMEHDYEAARQALAAAQTTVFSLDVSDADYHTLEVGLEQVAADTGGFYAKTHLFPELALQRLAGALDGHYLLSFAKPSLRPGAHRVRIRLVGHKGTVMARDSYIDSLAP